MSKIIKESSGTEQEDTEESSSELWSSGKGSGKAIPRFTIPDDVRTDSLDKLVSDEVTIARAMMRMNPLHSLSEQQRERVMKIKGGIKMGSPDTKGEHSGDAKMQQRNPEDFMEKVGFGGWSSTPINGTQERPPLGKLQGLNTKIPALGNQKSPRKGPVRAGGYASRVNRQLGYRHIENTAEKVQAITSMPIEERAFEPLSKNSKQGVDNTVNDTTQIRISSVKLENRDGAEKEPMWNNLSLQQHNQAEASTLNGKQQGETEPIVGNSYLHGLKNRDKGQLSDTSFHITFKKSDVPAEGPSKGRDMTDHSNNSGSKAEKPATAAGNLGSDSYRPQSKAEPLKLPPLQNQSLTQRYSLKRFPTIDKWMSRPEFSAVTEGDQNDFTTRTWSPVGHSTVLEGGIQYPNLFRERGNKLSWSRILKDAGQSVDGYRKIHAAKKKRESLDSSKVASRTGQRVGRLVSDPEYLTKQQVTSRTCEIFHSPLPDDWNFSSTVHLAQKMHGGLETCREKDLEETHDRIGSLSKLQAWTDSKHPGSPKQAQKQLRPHKFSSLQLSLPVDCAHSAASSSCSSDGRTNKLSSHYRGDTLFSEGRHQQCRLKSGEFL